MVKIINHLRSQLELVAVDIGQVENAEVRKPKYGKGSAETEVWKLKCRNQNMEMEVQKQNEKKSHLLVSGAFLTHDYALYSKRVTVSKQCGSYTSDSSMH